MKKETPMTVKRARFDDENGDTWRLTLEPRNGNLWAYTIERDFVCIYAGQVESGSEPEPADYINDFKNYIYDAANGLKEAEVVEGIQ